MYNHNLFYRESVFSYRVKPANSEWLGDAVLKNVHICHPQSRNIYGKVFGGFLMRNAFELAWVNAYNYWSDFIQLYSKVNFVVPI